ncbi:PHB depolymerase family esterase [Pseudonocardia ailaonensis]|uniref:PHB depolymerase family esterase n=1 Tax=Pseudonocardia ailaonensis TaxID=367279 RepID=A0ABN2NL08_9PSEU
MPFLLLIAIVAVSSPARDDSATLPVGTVVTTHTIAVGGVSRTFRTYALEGANSPLPLIVVLHGRGQSADTVLARTGFLGLVGDGRAVLAFPDGVGRSWNAGGGCCGVAAQRAEPDQEFVTDVVAATVKALPVDRRRIYLVGYSNGGKLAYAESCTHPTTFAAVATYGSVPLQPCDAPQARPVLIGAGQLDPILPYRGQPRGRPPLPSIDTAVAELRAQDGCTATPSERRDGPAVIRRWAGCRDGSAVELVVYPHLGHDWPTVSEVGTDAAVATLAWDFLAPFHLPAPPHTTPPTA